MNKINKPKVKYHGITASTNFKGKANDDDDPDDKLFGNKQLGYFSSQQTSTCIVVPIDEAVKDASYYRQVVQAINNTGEGDQIQFEINSPGGDLEGLIALLTAMSKTEATKVAHINGSAHSAASMLALNCDGVYLSPYASMLVHFISFGYSGKSTDVKSFVNHIHSTSEKLFRETYELFLTEDEIQKCIDGAELWLSSEEIARRLEYKYSIINAQEEVEDESEAEPEVTSEEEEVWTCVKEQAKLEPLPTPSTERKSRKKAS